MIGKHCGQYLERLYENQFYFMRRCAVCRTIFRQRKRLRAHAVAVGVLIHYREQA